MGVAYDKTPGRIREDDTSGGSGCRCCVWKRMVEEREYGSDYSETDCQ